MCHGASWSYDERREQLVLFIYERGRFQRLNRLVCSVAVVLIDSFVSKTLRILRRDCRRRTAVPTAAASLATSLF